MSTAGRRVRVMSYNLRGLRHGVDRVAAAIRVADPDVVLVQESGPRRRFRRLAERLSMRAAGDPRSFPRRIQDAILVRPPFAIASARLHRLSATERWYPRGALVARVTGDGVAFVAVSVHLGIRPRDRRAHGRELVAIADDLAPPVVLGGDLNEGPEAPAARALARPLVDAWAAAGSGSGETIPARHPTARIDYVFVSRDVELVACHVPGDPDVLAASDHLPVVADLRIPDAS